MSMGLFIYFVITLNMARIYNTLVNYMQGSNSIGTCHVIHSGAVVGITKLPSRLG